MEGYSVTEAASVLGVPTERVWELLARGVLSGAAEGETGMRVYLQPRPAPAPVEPKAPNGNGGTREPERELSPFRELLTEFRNLTERYGQALLALGEARGEVAALRSRVDLLEARMDLRLPMGPPQPAGWSSTPMPAPMERAVMPAAESVREPAGEQAAVTPMEGAAEPGPSEEERRTRARGPRRATESFAEALARAQDPSPPELPGGMEAAAALAALREQSEESADVGLPREVAEAEPIPVAGTQEALAPDATDAVEAAPGPMVDEGRATFEPPEEPVPIAAAVETETQVDPPVDLGTIESEPADVETAAAAPGSASEPVESPVETANESASQPVEGGRVGARVEPIEWDAQRYTTDIEEPDWFAAEVVEADAPSPVEVAPERNVEPEPQDAAEAEVPSAAAQSDAASPAVDEPPDASGADEMEVAPSATQPQVTQRPVAPAFPGASDLEDAIAALRAAGRAAEPSESPSAVEVEDALAVDADEWPPRSAFVRPATPGTGTRGPASRAYRRLRRIFPG